MQAYIYKADIYCEECGKELQGRCAESLIADNGDSDTYPQGPYSDGGGEADCPQHCGICGLFLENPLTSDGYRYVTDAIKANTGNPEVLATWNEFYGVDEVEL